VRPAQIIEDEAEARESFGALRIDPQRGLNERQRAVIAAAVAMQPPPAVQRLKILWLRVEHCGVEPVRLGSIACFLRGERTAQQARRIAGGS
jgi:hypothetical protein